MKKIKLTKGYSAQVDDGDFDFLSKFNWHATVYSTGVYAVRGRRISDGVGPSSIYMHRVILPGVVEVDHDDGNGLNNQRYNLKSATKSLNAQAFRRKRKGCYSEFRGVSWDKRCEKWIVQICAFQKKKFIGYFSDEAAAARAYDAAAKKLFKSSTAALNFP